MIKEVNIRPMILECFQEEYNMSETAANILYECHRTYELEEVIREELVGRVDTDRTLLNGSERVAERLVAMHV